MINTTRITKDIKLSDKCRDFNWINKQFQKGRLSLRGRQFNATSFNQFRLAVKTTQEIYEGFWDLDIQAQVVAGDDGNEKFFIDIKGIILHFPTLTIRNSENANHDIQDLFVKVILELRGSNLQVRGLDGGRTTISYAEFSSNYFHSHLPGYLNRNGSSASPYWSNFCRGSGHINDFIAELNSEGFTATRFTPFLVQITGLVSWESLEGGPHKKIRGIRINFNTGRRSSPNNSVAKQLKESIINKHKGENKIPDIEFSLESNQYTIKDNNKYKKFLEESVPFTDADKRRYLCMQDNTGQYYEYDSIPGYPSPPEITQKFIFQGREIPFSIGEAPDVGDQTNIEYFIHPTIRSFIKQELEYDINIKKIRKSTIDRYSNKTGNARKSTQPNQVVV